MAETDKARTDKRGTHEDKRVKFNPAELFNSNPYDLERLPKIQDWVFKWFRHSVMGAPDAGNIQKAMTMHWKPVLMTDLQAIATEQGKDISFLLETKWGNTEGVVGSHDMMLMMRPEEIEKAYQQHLQQMTNAQERAVTDQFKSSLPTGFEKMRPALIDED